MIISMTKMLVTDPGKAQAILAATHTDVHQPHDISSDNRFCCARM